MNMLPATGGYLGKIVNIRETDIRVGPIDSHSYVYRIGGRISKRVYANAESARADARRDQHILSAVFVEPIPEGH